MTKTIVGILIVLAVVGGGAFAWSQRDKDPAPTTPTPQSTDTDTSGDSTQEENQTPASETSTVSIEDFAFSPKTITVKKGTKVTWTNNDSAQHTVTPDEENSAFPGSDMLGKGDSYSVTFDVAGTYSYHCEPHPNMTGTVTVTE